MNVQEIHEFIGNCVLNNILLPPTTMGGRNITVQELIHNRSIESLERYADALEQYAPRVSRSEKRLGVEAKMVHPNLSYAQLIDAVDNIIQYRLEQEREEAKLKRIEELRASLSKLQTRDERRAQVAAELAALTGEVKVEDSAPPTQSTSA